MTKHSLSTWVTRSLIILFWLTAIISILYVPYLMQIFSQQKTITVLTWTDMIDPEFLNDFEKKTGVKVQLRYFENNEELFVKLATSKGRGFDIIITSDYMVEKLIKNNLVKQLDRAKFNYWDTLDTSLLNHYFDPDNKYSIPYHWAVYGIGLDKTYFNNKIPQADWNLLFDTNVVRDKIVMSNSPRETFLIAAKYLFNTIDNLTDSQINEIKNLLIKQKKHVEAYVDADVRANYMLLAKTSPVALIASPFIVNTLSQEPNIAFLIPQKGSFMIIDSIVLSSVTDNDEACYVFINYLFGEELLQHHRTKYPFFPSTQKFVQEIYSLFPQLSTIPLDFFRTSFSEKILNELWVSVKVS